MLDRSRKTLLSCLLSLTSSTAVCAETNSVSTSPLKIEFVASEPCALVQFVHILAGRHHTTTWVKDWYERKCKTTTALAGNLESDKSPIAAYQKLIDREEKHFHYVDEIGRERSVDEVILCDAAHSKTIPELLERLKNKLSLDEIATVQTVLYHFDHVYQNLIWKPRSAAFQKQLEEFRTKTVETRMCEKLTKVKDFLSSPWTSETPFIIALFPVPCNGKHTQGQSMGVVQTVELRPADGFEKSADVVFHEAVHALWFSKKDANETMKLFALPDKRALPITELYEGMATALGQGWFCKEAFGRQGKNWYADAIIDRYSKTVWPLYSDYLKQGRKLDAAFAKEATACYYRMYPDADKQINLTSCYLILADEMQDFSGFRKDVYKAMPRLRECSINTPINAKESFKSFDESHAEHAAILTSVSKVEELKPLGLSQFDIDKLKRTPNGWTTVTLRGKKVLFCLANTSEEQKKIFAEILKLTKWPGS